MADAADTNGRDSNGRFAAGNPGGPGGSRRRSSELRRAAEEAISPEHIQAMVRKATRMGLEGNLAAMRFVMERTCGRAAEAPVESEPLAIVLPALHTAADCNAAIERIVEGIVKGTVERDAAKLLLDAAQARLKAIEVNELETRLTALEEAAKVVDTCAVRNRRW